MEGLRSDSPEPIAPEPILPEPGRESLAVRYRRIRAATEALAAHLPVEDQVIQAMADASPTKWHLAHTTWFFEAFVLGPHVPGYQVFDPRYAYLFNSYYEALGPRHPRPARGLLGRPTVAEVLAWRHAVDERMAGLDLEILEALAPLLELGLQHEQQHQELILTDIKYTLWCNPLRPAYDPDWRGPKGGAAAAWAEWPGGIATVGHQGADFGFDNEGPAHQVLLRPFRLAPRPVTQGEFCAFIAEGGYRHPRFWLSDGWALAQAEGWRAPLYWEGEGVSWQVFTLGGMRPLDPAAPACHLSYYEGAAFAAWAGKRLPTEAEWEALAPHVLGASTGRVWEWTGSAYAPYPGYRPQDGAVGEYNGKFMVNQMVLRGGSRATPPGHTRPTYRNFFPPQARWQFSGLRLAEDG